jgi:rubredoxin
VDFCISLVAFKAERLIFWQTTTEKGLVGWWTGQPHTTAKKEGGNMSNQHCPGFEANKSLSEVKIKCPACGKEWAVFSDELGKNAKCADCGLVFDPKTAFVK